MATTFSSARAQAVLGSRTGYRRKTRCVFSREGLSRELEPVSGRIVQDARRKARWDGSLTFSGDAVLPRQPGDLLTPFGTRVEVELGLELLDGSTFYVPYGQFEIASSKVRVAADQRVVDVNLIDLSDRVDRYRFETPFNVASTTDLGNMINAVVLNRTGRNPNVGLIGQALGTGRIFGLDTSTGPWAEILDVLAGFSRTAWYNRVGQIEIGSQVPDVTSAYVMDSNVSLDIDYDTRPPNVIVARGEAQDGAAPVQAVAIDSDPSSPTYAGTGPGTSPYGRRTEFFSSPLIKSTAQAQAAANTILGQHIGAGATSTLVRPYDPTMTAGDVVAVGGIVAVVDSITLDLTGDTTCLVREL